MRLLNKNVSRDAQKAHGLWFEQNTTVALTKPKTIIFEITPPDVNNENDYIQVVEELESMLYTCSVATRFPSDLTGDEVHKDRCYILGSPSPS